MNTKVICNVFFLETHKINVRSGGHFDPLVSFLKLRRGIELNVLFVFIYIIEITHSLMELGSY
jgi:hypothetical protein